MDFYLSVTLMRHYVKCHFDLHGLIFSFCCANAMKQAGNPFILTSMTNPSPPITSWMTVKTILEKYPRAAIVFFRMGMHCPGCQAEAFHTLEEAARAHNRDPERLVDKLNRELFCSKNA